MKQHGNWKENHGVKKIASFDNIDFYCHLQFAFMIHWTDITGFGYITWFSYKHFMRQRECLEWDALAKVYYF